jgi:CO dehydrogenase/acetyl-CoA synthase epsilon subunit
MTDIKEMMTKACTDAYDQGVKDGLEVVLQLIKELRPAIRPLDILGKQMTTEEWFDNLAAAIKEKI